jgi:hypothetical protein
VQFTKDLERYFKKENQKKLEKIKEMQKESDLTDYEPGNILLVHLDFQKHNTNLTKKDVLLTNLLSSFLTNLEM